MRKLNFSGDITIDQVFDQYKVEIYDNVVKSIKDSLKSEIQTEISVLMLAINGQEYSVSLTRDKFVKGLTGALLFYESIEEYEKCQECLNIINSLDEKITAPTK